MEKLKKRRKEKNCPEQIESMDQQQLADERQAVKNELNALKEFASKQKTLSNNPNAFTEEDRIIMKQMYHWYCDLKKKQESLLKEQQSPKDKLLEDKKKLQLILHKYQTEFLEKNGRPVQTALDWEPLKKEYRDYKVNPY